jgi:hypothetical protein
MAENEKKNVYREQVIVKKNNYQPQNLNFKGELSLFGKSQDFFYF